MKFLAANRQFHLAIARASGNLRMLSLMTQLLDDMAKLLHLVCFRPTGVPDQCSTFIAVRRNSMRT